MAEESVVVPAQEPKKWFLSKMVWWNVAMGILPVASPVMGDWVKGHFEMYLGLVNAINVVLRYVTKDKIELW